MRTPTAAAGSAATKPGDAEERLPTTPTELVAATRRDLLTRAGRTAMPIRGAFVQHPRGSDTRPSVLSEFVRKRDQRGLNAYLMALAITSAADANDEWQTTLDIKVWARLFGTTLHAGDRSASTAVTKILKRLEDRKLIKRERTGRGRKIKLQLLREDGSGQDYTRPNGKTAGDRFLNLSHAYWLDGWDEKLSLPGLAMLLVALREQDGFKLATEHMPDWYGWSADTAERGFAELRTLGLLHAIKHRRFEAASPTGYSYFNTYELQPPFAPDLLSTGGSKV